MIIQFQGFVEILLTNDTGKKILTGGGFIPSLLHSHQGNNWTEIIGNP